MPGGFHGGQCPGGLVFLMEAFSKAFWESDRKRVTQAPHRKMDSYEDPRC